MSEQFELFEDELVRPVDGRVAPFFWFPAILIDSGDLAKMKGAPLAVLMVLTRYVNYQTNTTWPSIRKIADQSGFCPNSVRSGIETLIELGYLECVRKGSPAVGNSVYQLTFPNGEHREISPPRQAGAAPKHGGKPPKPKAESPNTLLKEHFSRKWEHAYGGKYPFQGAKDGVSLAEILKHFDGDASRAARAIDAYFADQDAFLTEANHPIALMRSRLHRYCATKAPKAGGGGGGFEFGDLGGPPLTPEERRDLWGDGDEGGDGGDR